MTQFTVTSEQLVSASSRISVDGGGDGTLPAASIGGAADETPLAGAWSSFVTDAITATTGLDTASIDLAGALRVAAGNYDHADSSSAQSLRPR